MKTPNLKNRALPAGSGPRRQRGFNLLEVMVALLVLSLGLLGLAALQTVGLKANHESYERTQATLLIYEILDRMRANPQGVVGGNYDLLGAPPSYTNCAIATCTPQELADYDVGTWVESLQAAGMLANSRATIETNQGPGGALVRIDVFWQESGGTKRQRLEAQLIVM